MKKISLVIIAISMVINILKAGICDENHAKPLISENTALLCSEDKQALIATYSEIEGLFPLKIGQFVKVFGKNKFYIVTKLPDINKTK